MSPFAHFGRVALTVVWLGAISLGCSSDTGGGIDEELPLWLDAAPSDVRGSAELPQDTSAADVDAEDAADVVERDPNVDAEPVDAGSDTEPEDTEPEDAADVDDGEEVDTPPDTADDDVADTALDAAGDADEVTDPDAEDTDVVTDAADGADADDATDTTDVDDVTDAADANDVDDGADADDASDATDADDVPDASDPTDADEVTDTTDADEVTDTTDADEVTDTTDADEVTDGADVADEVTGATDADEVTDTTDVDEVTDGADVADEVTDATVADEVTDTTDADALIDVGTPGSVYALSYTDHTVASGITGTQWLPTPSSSGNLCGEVSLLAGGAAVEDYDGDGDLDIFIPRLGLPAQLWTNDGDGTFVDRAAEFGIDEAELSNGAAWFDADGDGTFELFVSQIMGLNRLWQQTESGAWVDVAQDFNLAGLDVYAEQACQRVFGFQVGLLNEDDLLDVVLVRWGSRFTRGATQVLFGMPENGWRAAYGTGFVAEARTTAFTAHIFDFAGDDANDIYLTADFGRSRVFVRTDGFYADRTDDLGAATEENGMGTAIGDVNGDGLLDLFVTSIYGNPDVDFCNGTWGCSGNRMFLGTGDGFVDATDDFGVREGGWGWGAIMFDADNDSDTDVAMVNGYNLLWEDESLEIYRERSAIYNTDPSRLWRNDGVLPLTEVAASTGFLSRANERAIIPFDMDRDGDLDLIMIRNAERPRLLEAETDDLVSGVSVRFRGRADHGINSVVRLTTRPEATALVGYLRPFGLQASSRAHEVHFGLGEDAPATFHEIAVEFEDGTTARWTDVTSQPLIVLDLADAVVP